MLAARPSPPVHAGPPAAARSTILVVDDHWPNLIALEAVLSPLGEPIEQAMSGVEALRLLETGDFAVALLDVRMPGLSGLEVAARLRERGIGTPIIFLTAAQESTELRSRGYDRGAVDFILKPFDADVLRAKVRVFVELHKRRQERERLTALYDAERLLAKRRVQMLASLTARLSRWLSPEEVAAIVTSEVQDALEASASAVHLLPDNARQLTLSASRGLDAEPLATLGELPLDADAPPAAAIASGQATWIEGREALQQAFPKALPRAQAAAFASLPLSIAGRALGALSFAFDAPQAWDALDKEFFLTVAAQVAGALERARLMANERAAYHDLRRQTNAMRFMADVGTLLSSSLEYEAILRQLTQMLVPVMADWCAIDVLDDGGQVARLIAFHSDPNKIALAHELERRYPVDPSSPRGVPNVLRTGQTEWMEEIPDALIESVARDAEHLGIIQKLGLRSYVVVPLRARGRILGALSLIYAESGRHYSEDDVRYLEELAARAALSVDNALLFREAQRLIAQLDRSNKELDQFAYVASHDLKAPLRGIANLSQWLEEDLADAITPDAKQQLELLRNRVHRMEALINGILDYSRAGRVRAKPEALSVHKLLADVIELISPPPGATIEIGPGMPELRTERVPLQQVFLNLIGNALKHAKKSEPRVSISVQDAGAHYEFSVSDDGPGIAPEYHDRIWGIFQTLEPRDTVEGTGVGLSVVKKIVESKGGRASIDSREGAGARFSFTWPKTE